jgi:hypothetical protein
MATKCVICNKRITIEANGWDGGHNAEPYTTGRCCAECNYSKVLPLRLRFYEDTIKEYLSNVKDGKSVTIGGKVYRGSRKTIQRGALKK